MTVVFDSGVWISALHFGGIPREALLAASRGATVALSEPIAAEIATVLQSKFRWRTDAVNHAISRFGEHILRVPFLHHVRGVCRDPDDDMVLDCAVTAGASLIVSGDQDLLVLGEYEGIRILTPRAFLDEFPAPPLP